MQLACDELQCDGAQIVGNDSQVRMRANQTCDQKAPAPNHSCIRNTGGATSGNFALCRRCSRDVQGSVRYPHGACYNRSLRMCTRIAQFTPPGRPKRLVKAVKRTNRVASAERVQQYCRVPGK